MEQARKDIARLEDVVDRLKIVAVGALVVALLSVAVCAALIANAGKDKYTKDQAVAGCERSKADRLDMARGATAQSDYLRLVLGAASVKSDVKTAAVAARDQWEASAQSLRSRLFVCGPLINDQREVIDQHAVAVAKGHG